MKIIKPVLLGPKLIAVGPLKCFKGNGGGGSSSGGSRGGGGKGGTGEQSSQQREAQLQTDAFRKKQQEAEAKSVVDKGRRETAQTQLGVEREKQKQRDAQAAKESDARQAEVRRQEKLRQEAAARAKAKEEEQEKEAQRLVQKGLRETKETEVGAEREQEREKKAERKMLSDREDSLRKRQAIMDYEKGVIEADDYEAVTGEKPKQRSIFTRRNFINALGLVPKAGGPLKKIGQTLSEKFSDPTTVTEAGEDIAVEQERTAKAKEPKPSVAPPVRRGEPKSTPAPAAPAPVVAAAPAPAPKPEPKPVEQLTPDEVGESIVKKEAKMIRERSLAQQLASIRGLRGVSPGQKARLLQRSQERFDREFAPQVQIALMKERETRRKEQQDLSEAEKNRQNALERQKLASGKGVVSSASDKPSWLKGLEAVSTGLDKADDILSTFDFFGAEGGFVSGPGTETSDSIPARLSDGEFVVKASAVRGLGKAMGAKGKEEERKKGVDFLYKVQDKMGKKAEGGEIKPDFDRFLKFMDKGVSHGLMKKRIEKARISKKEKEKLLKGLGKEPKFAKGGEAYARPKKAFKEAIGYEPESRFHDKAAKDAKHGGARRKFRHFQDGGSVDIKGPGVVKDQFKMPSSGYGAVVSAQGDLMRRIEELERKVGK